jgi:hypothetical protein
MAANSTNEKSGTADFKRHMPADIVFDTRSGTASVLLLNDKYDAELARVRGRQAGGAATL